MKYGLIIRILLYIGIFFSIINGWWFIALPLLLVGIWLFAFRFEIIISGILYDALFGMIPGTGIWGYVGTLTAIIMLIILGILKRMVR